MRFRIAPEQKQRVTIVRPLADRNGEEQVIATDIVCVLIPRSDLVPRTEHVNLRAGLPMGVTGWIALLEVPNSEVAPGDILRNSEDKTFRVQGIRQIHGSEIMELELNQQGVL